MLVTLTLEVEDDSYEDPEHPMGITNAGFEALLHALESAGFAISDGPKAVQNA